MCCAAGAFSPCVQLTLLPLQPAEAGAAAGAPAAPLDLAASFASWAGIKASIATPPPCRGPLTCLAPLGALNSPLPQDAPAAGGEEERLSIFLRDPLPETSPLRLGDRSPSSSSDPASRSSSSSRAPRGSGRRTPAVVDKPVTFHSRIKSSGYGLVHDKPQLGKVPSAPQKVSTALLGRGSSASAALTKRQVGSPGSSMPQKGHLGLVPPPSDACRPLRASTA